MRQLSKEEAIKLGNTHWWLEFHPSIVTLFQINQHFLCMDYSCFHESVEATINRSVFSHEFAQPEKLKAELKNHIDCSEENINYWIEKICSKMQD